MLDDEQIESLIEQAREASRSAYCPYSEYAVGAVALTENGETFWGCNIENASFGTGLCAERVAVASAVANGYRSFAAVAVYHKGDELPYPCGACRQFLSEFGLDTEIIVATDETYEICSLAALLPHCFDSETLG